MHRHLSNLGRPLLAAFLLAMPLPVCGQIVAVEENGRTVYVNDDTPAERAQRRASYGPSMLVYWSQTERRWKTVPRPSRRAMRAARSAAAEVNQYVANRPRRRPGNSQSAQVKDLESVIEETAVRHGVDPNLVRAVVQVESNFDPEAVSHKGAMGLMQLMPQTARSLNVNDPFDARQNVDGGVRYLRHLLDTYQGDVNLSLAAYNAGPGAVDRHAGVPPYRETRNYVKRISQLYWNRENASNPERSSGRTWTPRPAPIRVTRTEEGTVRFSNTD